MFEAEMPYTKAAEGEEMSFADNLRMIRKERNITQEQLADMLDVSRQAVSKWESGMGYPETEKLLIISKELNVSLDYLLKEESNVSQAEKETPKPVAYAPGGKIAIPTFDNANVVVCHAVKSSKIMAPAKKEPGYILLGIDKVTFWGEHTTILGWYVSAEDVQQEIKEITETLNRGEGSYTLKYAADVEFKGIFGQPKLK